MKRNYPVMKLFIFSFTMAFILFSCEKSENTNTPLSGGADNKLVTLGAGTNYTLPNSFDGGGLICFNANGSQPVGSPMELWMGVGNEKAGTLVGHVTFLSSPDRVKIDLNDLDGDGKADLYPYVITAAHIHFAPTIDGIPHSSTGNPIPGQFEYNIPVGPYKTELVYEVEFDAVGAIHLAVVKYGGVDGFNFYLPNTPVTLRITDYPSAGDPSYFKMKITDGGFISEYNMGYGAGIYEAWCIDVDHGLPFNVDYPGFLYSSYETLPEWMVGDGKIEKPENLDLINYLVNNFVTGQIVQPKNGDCSLLLGNDGLPVTQEALTFSDIQRAIWTLIDNDQTTSGLSGWSQFRVNSILCNVIENGEGFVPACSQKIVFLVVPTGTPGSFKYQIVIGQPIIAEIEVPCADEGGTAWGDGKFGAGFPGARQWGTFFSTVCPAPTE